MSSVSGDPLKALGLFSVVTRDWFAGTFAAPTPAQADAWSAIADGHNTLVIAPTGSGKTLAAFLWAIDALASAPRSAREPGTRVLYVSPLKALAVDVERNLRTPLAGMARVAAQRGLPTPEITVGLRSGDTPPAQRRQLVSNPPDVLITTPESLFLMLTSAARQTLAGVQTVIVDEVHAIAGTKRGAHLGAVAGAARRHARETGSANWAFGHRAPRRRGRPVSLGGLPDDYRVPAGREDFRAVGAGPRPRYGQPGKRQHLA